MKQQAPAAVDLPLASADGELAVISEVRLYPVEATKSSPALLPVLHRQAST